MAPTHLLLRIWGLGVRLLSGARVAGRSEPDGVVALPISLFQQTIPGTTPLLGTLRADVDGVELGSIVLALIQYGASENG